MRDLNDKVTGGTLTAAEWNDVPSELQNIIEDMGITLSAADLDQVGKAIAGYVGSADFYSETGAADAYVATKIGAKQAPVALDAVHDGLMVRFRPGNANTGASTLNVNGLGAKDLIREGGAALSANDLETTRDAVCRYDQAADDFRLLDSALPMGAIASVPRGYIDGLTTSNGTDADHDVDVAVGIARSDDDTRTLQLASALGKQIDVAWAAGGTPGVPAGGFPSGLTLTANTWYHLFVIRNTSTGVIDGGFDTATNAATLLADATGYAAPRRIGSVLTDSVSNIIAYTQFGDEFLWDSPPLDVSATISTTSATPTMSVPPDFKVQAIVDWSLEVTTSFAAVPALHITSPDQDDETAGASGRQVLSLNSSTSVELWSTSRVVTRTNASRQLRYVGSTTSSNVDVKALAQGWYDRRGKDA